MVKPKSIHSIPDYFIYQVFKETCASYKKTVTKANVSFASLAADLSARTVIVRLDDIEPLLFHKLQTYFIRDVHVCTKCQGIFKLNAFDINERGVIRSSLRADVSYS